MTYGDLKKWCAEHNITDDHKIQFMNIDTEEWFVSWERNPFDRFTSEDCKRLFFEIRLKTESDYENETNELKEKRNNRSFSCNSKHTTREQEHKLLMHSS